MRNSQLTVLCPAMNSVLAAPVIKKMTHKETAPHGCINLQFEDSEKLWGLLDRNDLVYVWGHKTGV